MIYTVILCMSLLHFFNTLQLFLVALDQAFKLDLALDQFVKLLELGVDMGDLASVDEL